MSQVLWLGVTPAVLWDAGTVPCLALLLRSAGLVAATSVAAWITQCHEGEIGWACPLLPGAALLKCERDLSCPRK